MTSERISLELVTIPAASPGLVRRILGTPATWRVRAQQRAALARFDERMLRDIGLAESDVWRERRLPPWIG